MKRFSKVFIVIALSFATLLTGIGFAKVSTTLTVEGTVEAGPPEAVYIYQAVGSSNATVQDFNRTVLNSIVTLQSSSSTATITVSVKNNTAFEYFYNEAKFTVGEDTYSNENIKFTVSGIKQNDSLAIGATKTFTVTFSFESGASTSNNVLKSVINFDFTTTKQAQAVTGALEKFEKILDTKSEFNKVIDYMNTNTSGRDETYVGNVVGASSADTAFLNELFTEDGENKLVLEIEGEKTNVTLLIKRENLDGNTTTGENGNEMSIYMTAVDLDRVSWRSWVVTYVAVFTTDPNSEDWYQLGPLFAGRARAIGYNGGIFAHDSIDTRTWESTQSYFGASSGSSASEVVSAFKSSLNQ